MSPTYGLNRQGHRVAVEKRGDEYYLDGEQVTTRSFAGGAVTLESATWSATLDKHAFAQIPETTVAPAARPTALTPEQAAARTIAVPDAAYRTRSR